MAFLTITGTYNGGSASSSGLVELHGWNRVMEDGSQAPGHHTSSCSIDSSVALSAARFTLPACSITSSGSPEMVLFLTTRYECTKADANYGEGWEDHYLPKPRPIHLIPADTDYRWITNGPADNLALSWQWCNVRARFSEFESVPDSALDRLCRRGFEDDLIRRLIERLCSEGNENHPHGKLFVDSLFLSLLLALLGRQQQDEAAGTPRERLSPSQHRRVIEYMHAHLHEDIGLPHLADLCGMSAGHFSRAFKALTGGSPYRFLLDLRVAKAQELLSTGQRPIADIALLTGFGDQSRFAKVFRQALGMSPAAYRSARRGLPD